MLSVTNKPFMLSVVVLYVVMLSVVAPLNPHLGAATFSAMTLSITKLYAEFWHADDVLLSVVGPIVEAYD